MAIAILLLATRLAFVGKTLWAWDSVLFARSLENGFHVSADLPGERPQPPGYFFFIAVARGLATVVGDSNAALALESALSSALAAVLLYVLVRRLAGGGAAATASLGFATAPLTWLMGAVALSYATLAACGLALALAFHRARSGGERDRALASLLYGGLAGFRQDLLLFFFPLWLWMLAPASWRSRAVAVVATGAGCVLWFVPTAVLSGGPAAYLASVVDQVSRARASGSVANDLALVLFGIAWSLGALAIVLVVAVARVRPWLREGGNGSFFALWILPALLFYVWVHTGDPAYVLSFVPGICAFASVAVGPLLATRLAQTLAALAVLANAAVFLITGAPYSVAALAAHDRTLADRVAWVRANSSPDGALVVAREQYLFARYYLPEYHVAFRGDAPERLSRDARPVELGGGTVLLVDFADRSARAATPDEVRALGVFDLEPR